MGRDEMTYTEKVLNNFLQNVASFGEVKNEKPEIGYIQYVKWHVDKWDIDMLKDIAKPTCYGNNNDGVYIMTFVFNDILGYSKIKVVFQYGIYKSSRVDNATIVDLFHAE